MRKRMINQDTGNVSLSNQQWLNVEHLAQVEVSSEDAAHPIESALMPSTGPGWRAGQPGQQTVRLLFDAPQMVRHIRLLFKEDGQERTQELCCGGPQTAVSLTGKLCVSNITSAHPAPPANARIMMSSSTA